MSNREMTTIDRTKITFFVAVNGNDTWSGKLPEPSAEQTGGPFAAVGCARNAVRASSVGAINEPVTVPLRGGECFLEEPAVLGHGRSHRRTGEDERTAFLSRWKPTGYEAYSRIKP